MATLEIINVMLSSIDGHIAAFEQENTRQRFASGMANGADNLRLKKLVATCDAVFIGAKSLQSEQGILRVKEYSTQNQEPTWFIFTQNGISDFSADFWKYSEIRKEIFFCTSFAADSQLIYSKKQQELNNELLPTSVGTITGLLAELQSRQVKRIALLGGGVLNYNFWQAKLVDRLYLTLSPYIIGCKLAPSLLTGSDGLLQQLQLEQCTKEENFVFLEYITKKETSHSL